jgi:hypothetical protein
LMKLAWPQAPRKLDSFVKNLAYEGA